MFYLKQLIEKLCLQGEVGITIVPSTMTDTSLQTEPPAPESYQIWSMHDRTKGSKETVWRIRQPMGITKPGGNYRAPGLTRNAAEKADLLVIDDLGLGFCDLIKDHPLFFSRLNNDADIILKTSHLRSAPHLWGWFFQADEGRKYLDKLTVVLSVNTLRKRGASISKGLSWDMTIEDTVREMEGGCSMLDLALCKRVVIHFDYEGIASFRKKEPGGPPEMEFFLYHPTEYEGMFSGKRPGLTFGTLSIIAASIAYHTVAPNAHPLFLALCRGLEAARENHEEGGGSDPNG